MHRVPVGLVALALLLTGCVNSQPVPGTPPSSPPTSHWLNPQDGANAPGTTPHPFRGLAPRAYVETSKGTFVLELGLELVPTTVSAFIARAQAGGYDNTKFHRLVRDAFIQGGDPNSRSDDRSSWGSGGFPENPLADEFHPLLRHDVAGTVSMATGQPDSVGSQFFITLAPDASLDDRFPVIGYVVAGMDVVRAIAAGPALNDAPDGQPVTPVAITRISVVFPDPSPESVRHSVNATVPMPDRTVPPNYSSTALLIVRNTGNVRDNISLLASGPLGWTITLNPSDLDLPAGVGRAVIVTATVPPAALDGTVGVVARSQAQITALATAEVRFHPAVLGSAPTRGQNATAEYAGFLLDGRLFDTNVAAVAHNPGLVTMSSFFRPRSAYEPYEFTLGQGVVEGFTWLAERTPVGASEAAWIPWNQGYVDGDRGKNPLIHRDVLFELHLLAS